MGYDYSTYGSDNSAIFGLIAGMGTLIWIISMAISVFSFIVIWKIFKKANKPGWAAIVPGYNMYVLFEITWGKGWLFLTMFAAIIPVIGWIVVTVIYIITLVKLAKSFGKNGGFAIGLLFLNVIFMAILAFGKDEYVGPLKKNNEPITSTEPTSVQNPQPIEQPVNPQPMETPSLIMPTSFEGTTPINPLQMPQPTDTTLNPIQAQQPTAMPQPSELQPQIVNNPIPIQEPQPMSSQQPVMTGTTNTTICPHCNASISEDIIFCPTCGKQVK